MHLVLSTVDEEDTLLLAGGSLFTPPTVRTGATPVDIALLRNEERDVTRHKVKHLARLYQHFDIRVHICIALHRDP